MRSHSFFSLALSGAALSVFASTAAAHTKGPVVVWITSTITACPSPVVTLACSDADIVSESELPSSNSIVAASSEGGSGPFSLSLSSSASSPPVSVGSTGASVPSSGSGSSTIVVSSRFYNTSSAVSRPSSASSSSSSPVSLSVSSLSSSASVSGSISGSISVSGSGPASVSASSSGPIVSSSSISASASGSSSASTGSSSVPGSASSSASGSASASISSGSESASISSSQSASVSVGSSSASVSASASSSSPSSSSSISASSVSGSSSSPASSSASVGSSSVSVSASASSSSGPASSSASVSGSSSLSGSISSSAVASSSSSAASSSSVQASLSAISSASSSASSSSASESSSAVGSSSSLASSSASASASSSASESSASSVSASSSASESASSSASVSSGSVVSSASSASSASSSASASGSASSVSATSSAASSSASASASSSGSSSLVVSSSSSLVSSSASSSAGSSSSIASSSASSSLSSSSSISISSSASLSSSSSISSASSSVSASASPSSTCSLFYLENIQHQGVAPYADASGYEVFRNVKEFGAVGDGVTDDTAAINKAIAATSKSTSGGRCGPGTGCQSTTTKPALVYFPAGTYLVSAPIVDYYLTQLVGNPDCPPTIKVAANWASSGETPYAVIDGNVNEQWTAVNIFWRQIKNFVIDMTAAPATLSLAGIHWSTGQATSLQNIVFEMSTASDTAHQGVWSEEGSGGFLSDLTFNGGLYGLNFGNQQYTMRALTFNGCQTAIRQIWDWTWLYKGLTINNCKVGIDVSAGYPSTIVSDVLIVIDSTFNNVETAIIFAKSTGIAPAAAGELIAENLYFNGVTSDIQQATGNTVLSGSQKSIGLLGYGHGYQGTVAVTNLGTVAYSRPSTLLSGSNLYEFSKPSYSGVKASQVLSARTLGAVGDGVTDDTAALQAAFAASAATGKLLFIDYGVYLVSATITIPAGARVVGESYPVIMSYGAAFNQINAPIPVIQVGAVGSVGTVELSDFVVSSRGAQAGAILIQWNLSGAGSGSFATMWDVHTRVGGFTGSDLSLADCPMQNTVTVTSANLNSNCMAAFASFYLPSGVEYVYLENTWFWVADHDADDADLTQITVYAGRGILLEGSNLILYGVAAEHHSQYQFNVHNGNNIVMGVIQSETAYYQPNPGATLPFPVNSAFGDPTLAAGQSGWGAVYSGTTQNTLVYGAGHYSFFDNNDKSTCEQYSCQSTPLVSIQGTAKVTIFGLVTTGVSYMIDYLGTSVANAELSANYGDFMGVVGVFSSAFVTASAP